MGWFSTRPRDSSLSTTVQSDRLSVLRQSHRRPRPELWHRWSCRHQSGTNVIAEANAVAIDARTGDIVVAGSALHLSDSQSRFAVVRYTSNGALLGSVETSFSNTTLLNPTSDRAFAVVIDGAGRIIAQAPRFR